MKIEFHRTGAERKALVTAIGEILEVKPKYKGMPSAAYEIDYFTVTKDGSLEFDDMADSEEVEHLLESLTDRGIATGMAETAQAWLDARADELSEEPETEPQGETVWLTVAMPLEQVQVGNLTNLLEAKGSLIKKALGISELPIEITEEQISFPWFSDGLDADTVKAYTDFIAALCRMSREQKRISSTEKAVENEKYAFRCLLLRLGFVGAEYKADRKILLKNLTGSSAFKSGAKKEVSDDEISE